MAANPIPTSYPSLLVHATDSFQGVEDHGAEIPIVLNTAALIGADRQALIDAQEEYEAARGALNEVSAEHKAAVKAAYDFCFIARDVIAFHCGRSWSTAWIAAGWLSNRRVPQAYDGLYALVMTLNGYFEAHPTFENEGLGVTAEAAQGHVTALQSARQALEDGETFSLMKRDVRNAKMKAMRKRLSGLCKELSQRLDDMDLRWRWFGFNLPGAPTVPEVPEGVSVFELPGARFQISCDPSVSATSYRFYAQRPIIDPAPVALGTSYEPLFVTEPLVAGAEYLIYVSASNEGAESNLSEPVPATAEASAAA